LLPRVSNVQAADRTKDLPAQLGTPLVLGPHGDGEVPGREHQALWFALASRRIASVVLVPADGACAVAELATALANVGRRLGDNPVTAVVSDAIDYEFVTRTAALVALTRKRDDVPPGASPLEVIVAIHPVTVEPLGLALVQAADATILCVKQGHTGLAAARKTVALVGRERLIGSILVP
jgi:hypothetical protein